jgi:hypothetical protein
VRKATQITDCVRFNSPFISHVIYCSKSSLNENITKTKIAEMDTEMWLCGKWFIGCTLISSSSFVDLQSTLGHPMQCINVYKPVTLVCTMEDQAGMFHSNFSNSKGRWVQDPTLLVLCIQLDCILGYELACACL